MADIEMTRDSGVALVRPSGDLVSVADARLLHDMLELVPSHEQVIVDLSEVQSLSPFCATELRAAVIERTDSADAVVVSCIDDVTMQVVLSDVDRTAPVVRTVESAVALLRARSGDLALGAGI